MARRKGRFFVWLIVIVVLAVGAYFGYNYIKDRREKEPSNAGISTDTWLTIIETKFEFRQESTTIDLLKGTIKTNEQVDKVFVNINGIGTQYLDFTPSLIQTTNSTYIAHAIEPIDAICSVGVVQSQTVTVDIYVEYGGRSFKVDTQKVAVVSSEFGLIGADVEYKQGSTSICLKNGVVKTNKQVDKIFVNINGVGVEELEFTSKAVTTEDGTYYEHTITERNGICSTCFGDDATVTADLYVEYAGRSYKVDTQEVSVLSGWTKNY